ncbi:MAG: transcriptional regulator [Eubacterium sp.]|jgi:DNA-binding transcriptional ArsR family regulator|nr:transcriptional regulator [Eubacterium sp.]
MMVTVNKQINYVEEANSLLYSYVNSDSYEKMKQDGSRKITYSAELYNKRYQHILNIYNYVIENIRFEKVQLEYYFKEIGKSGMGLSSYLFPLYTEVQYDSLTEYETAARSKSKVEIIRDFDYILSQHYTFGKSDDYKTIDSFEELMRSMNKGDFSSEDKWKIVQTYLEHDKHLDELCLIFDRTIQLLKERSDEVKILEGEFYDYWVDYTNNHNFLEELQKYASITWQFSETGNVMIPAIFRPNSITISSSADDDKKADIIHVGIILDANLTCKPARVDNEDLNNALKLLSDKSKFEILKYIKSKPAYGFEIANAFNLSTSTISYHMNGLIQARLVKIEKEANKIYYSLNKETVEEILKDIGEMLL